MMSKLFPRASSSTRISLLLLVAVLAFATIRALVNGSEYFQDILAVFTTTIGTIVGFFFGQRSTELDNFISKENEW